MHNHDITTITLVRHPDGGRYSVSSTIALADDIATVRIHKDGFGECFHGSPDQAREQGFLFGDEARPGGLRHGTTVTHTAYPGRLYGYTPTESIASGEIVYDINRGGVAVATGTVATLTADGFQFNQPGEEPETWEDKDGVISDLRGEVKTLTGQLTACQRERSEAIIARGAADRALETYKERVRTAIVDAAKEHDLCREGTNAVLGELGLPDWKATWKVTVTRDNDGATLLTVTGIEADTESEAEREVRDNFTVSATVKRVKYDYSYSGDGEEDWDEDEFDDDDLDDDDDNYPGYHKDDLTFTAEEE